MDNTDEYSTEYVQAVPDLPEVNVMLDALEDSVDQMDAVAGGESISLTANQRYFAGVLFANGVISHSQLAGNEEGGVFSAIGNGFAAAWKWLCDMFKSVWGFFFGRDNAEEADKTKKEIDEQNKDATAAENGTQSDEDAKKQASAMASVAAENGDQVLADELRAARTPQEVKAAVKVALKKIHKLNKKAKLKAAEAIKAAVTAKNGFNKIVTDEKNRKYSEANDRLMQSNHAAVDVLIDIEAEVNKVIVKDRTFIPMLDKAMELDTVGKVVAFGRAIQANVDAMKTLGESFNQKKSKMQSIFNDTEKQMKEAKEGKDKERLKLLLGTLRVVMNRAIKVAKLIEISNVRLRAAHIALIKIFAI
ncbi:hypothetical protein D3C79_47630 [compost metagenome]